MIEHLINIAVIAVSIFGIGVFVGSVWNRKARVFNMGLGRYVAQERKDVLVIEEDFLEKCAESERELALLKTAQVMLSSPDSDAAWRRIIARYERCVAPDTGGTDARPQD